MSKRDLLYTPNIKHTESYYTEGQIERKKYGSESEKIKIKKEDRLKKLYEEVKMKVAFIPNQILDAYFSPLLAMKNEFENIIKDIDFDKDKDKEEDKIPPVDPPITPEIKPEVKPVDPEDIFDKDDDIYIDIIDPDSDFEININDGYNSNFIEIYEDYLIKVDNSLNDFIFEIMEINKSEKIDFEIAEMDSIAIKNQNLIHLSDYIVKSNIYLQQNTRLHKKVFNIDESIFHIKAPKIAKEQMLRYYKAEYLEETNELNVKNNLLLKESRFISEKKYNDNTRDLYKYLNSQVILLRDSLSSITKQMTSLAVLSREGEGNKGGAK